MDDWKAGMREIESRRRAEDATRLTPLVSDEARGGVSPRSICEQGVSIASGTCTESCGAHNAAGSFEWNRCIERCGSARAVASAQCQEWYGFLTGGASDLFQSRATACGNALAPCESACAGIVEQPSRATTCFNRCTGDFDTCHSALHNR